MDVTERALTTAVRIAEKPAAIRVIRDGVVQPAQTVRIDPYAGSSYIAGQGAVLSVQAIMVTGYKDHPSLADTDLRRGDRFYVEGEDPRYRYEVKAFPPQVPGRMIALADAEA